MLPDMELMDGFHAIERDESGSFVWTKGRFRMKAVNSGQFAKIQLCYYGDDGQLSVRNKQGKTVDRVDLQRGWQTSVVRLAAEEGEPLVFDLDPIIPVAGDSRELGLMLRSLEMFDDESQVL